MLKCAALFALCTVALAINSQLDDTWEAYKLIHGKNYDAVTDYERRSIWEYHLKYIENHNKEADQGIHTYRLGMNAYGDMSTAELVATLNGYRQVIYGKDTNLKFETENQNLDLPTTVDWRKKGYVTGVKNQAACGSCWAFSATGSLEGQHFKKTGNLVSLSEQNLIDCSRKEGNQGCRGGLMDNAFQYVKDNNGIDTESSYPYLAKDVEDCKFKRANVGDSLSKYIDVQQGSEQALKVAVAQVGPVSVAIDANHTSLFLYKSGVYNEPSCSSTHLDHGVLAVGYGTSNGQDYWLVKNSWGVGWGMEGFVMMSRNKDNQCGIATAASFPVV